MGAEVGRRIMKLWILSDLHDDRGLLDIERPADFDVFVCAGDCLTGDIEGSIERTAELAGGKPAVFAAGNHEWAGGPLEVVAYKGRAAAEKHDVHWLELDTVEIGVARFAGATLWTPDDVRHGASAGFLRQANADVVVTHFEPAPEVLFDVLPSGGLWVHGHHHGFMDRTLGSRRIVRNALGYGGEVVDGEPARPGYVVEFES